MFEAFDFWKLLDILSFLEYIISGEFFYYWEAKCEVILFQYCNSIYVKNTLSILKIQSNLSVVQPLAGPNHGKHLKIIELFDE